MLTLIITTFLNISFATNASNNLEYRLYINRRINTNNDIHNWFEKFGISADDNFSMIEATNLFNIIEEIILSTEFRNFFMLIKKNYLFDHIDINALSRYYEPVHQILIGDMNMNRGLTAENEIDINNFVKYLEFLIIRMCKKLNESPRYQVLNDFIGFAESKEFDDLLKVAGNKGLYFNKIVQDFYMNFTETYKDFRVNQHDYEEKRLYELVSIFINKFASYYNKYNNIKSDSENEIENGRWSKFKLFLVNKKWLFILTAILLVGLALSWCLYKYKK